MIHRFWHPVRPSTTDRCGGPGSSCLQTVVVRDCGNRQGLGPGANRLSQAVCEPYPRCRGQRISDPAGAVAVIQSFHWEKRLFRFLAALNSPTTRLFLLERRCFPGHRGGSEYFLTPLERTPPWTTLASSPPC